MFHVFHSFLDVIAQDGCPEIDGQRQQHQYRGDPQDGFDHAVGRGRCTVAFFALLLGLEIDMPEAEPDKDKRDHGKIVFVGLKRGQGTDPSTAHAEHQKDKGQNAA